MKLILIFLCCLLSFNSNAQANDAEALLYNVSISGVFSTVGAIINKKPEDKLGKVIAKGLAQGSLGGLVTFGSKTLLRQTKRQSNWRYIWGAKILNAAGTSIKENAAMNRDFWEKWHVNIGFNRLEVDAKNNYKLRYKIMPITFLYVIDAFVFRDAFLVNESLKTGEFIFADKNMKPFASASAGYIVVNSNYFDKNNYNYPTIVHEIIHLYQSNDYYSLNTYYQKPVQKWGETNKTIRFLNKYLDYDFHYIPLRATYLMESKGITRYYDNYLEHEAGYYSNTL